VRSNKFSAYLTHYTQGNTEISPPHIVELFEPLGKSSRSEAEGLFPVIPRMEINKTALSSGVCHEPDIARLVEGDAEWEEC